MIIDSEGRLFGRINIIDIGILLVLLLALLGAMLARAGYAGINAKVKGTAVVEVDCLIRGSLLRPADLFKAGDRTFITLRNVPYSSVAVVAIHSQSRMIAVPSPDGKAVTALPDPTEPYGKDLLVTIRERAALTDDGVVFGDSKVKVGVPIELEGFKYRLKGSIVDIRINKS
ncbi:MAG: DUF4330 domain-containing protein [Cyanobacteria bacterium NC_groundwater_1444_Ag_S-0.65um_54_12]|nr:DUF4330 domain-containing protein [Cyanobacteria bacterium NC_groundwater_1444_Ag_S-0.65um_54_12]